MNMYQPNPDSVVNCFWVFGYRFNSLYRHWTLNKELTNKHLRKVKEAPSLLLKQIEKDRAQYYKEKAEGKIHNKDDKFFYEADWSEEIMTDHYENEHNDIEFFPEFLKGSILSMSLSLLETLLEDLSVEIAKDLNIPIELPTQGSFLQRYLNWLEKNCGLNVELTKQNKKHFMAIGAVRNKYIHKLDRDLPEDIRNIITKMIHPEEKEMISYNFIEKAFEEINHLTEKLEAAYLKFYQELKQKKLLDDLDIPEDLR